MANFIQKMIIRSNPRYIEKIKSEDLTIELLEYAFERGYDVSRASRLINTKVFLEYYKKHKSFSLNDLIALNFFLISSEFSEEYKHEIIYNSDYVLKGHEYGAEELNSDFDLILKSIRKDPTYLNRRYTTEIPDDRVEEFIEVLEEKEITANDWSVNRWKDNNRVVKYFLSKDYDKTFEIIKSQVSSEGLITIFVDNLPNGIEHIDEILGKYYWSIDTEYKERIIDVIKNTDYIINDKTPDFIKRDKEIVYNSLLNDPSSERYLPSDFGGYDKYSGVFSEEESKEIAIEVLEHNYLPTGFLKEDARISSEIIALNPYIMDFSYYNFNAVPSDYIYNVDNAHLFVNYNNFYEELERNFDVVSKSKRIEVNREDSEKIYKACKENNYILTSDSPLYLMLNPYLVMDALENGNIEIGEIPFHLISDIYKVSNRLENFLKTQDEETVANIRNKMPREYLVTTVKNLKEFSNTSGQYLLNNASYEQQKNPDFIMESIRKNFASIKYAYANISDFTVEQQKEIARLYFEYPNRNNLFRNFQIGEIISKNQYIQYEKYKRGEDVFESNIMDEEILKEMAENYWKTKGNLLTAESFSLERSNHYIIEKSIEIDPQTIDYANLKISPELQGKYKTLAGEGKYKINAYTPTGLFSEEEMIERYYNLIIEGNEKLPLDTPKKILENPKIKDYLLQDINNIIYYQDDIWENRDLITRIDEAIILDKFVFGDIIPPIYYRNYEVDYNIVEYILSKDIHNIEKMDVDNKYVIELINSGRYPIDENANAKFLSKSGKIFMATFRKNNNIIFMDEFKNEKIYQLTMEEQREIADTINSNYILTEDSPYILKSNVYVIKNSLKNDIESAKFCNGIINDEIKEFVANLNIEYSEELPSILKENHPNRPLTPFQIRRLIHNDVSQIKIYYERHKNFIDSNSNDFIQQAIEQGIILDADYPEFMRNDNRLVLRTLENDWSFIEHVSPLIRFDNEMQARMIELAIKNNYIIDENSLYFFRRSPTLVLNAIKNNEDFDISLVDYVDFSLCSKDEEKEFHSLLEDAIIDGKYKISEYTHANVRADKEIFIKFIENDISNLSLYENKLFLFSQEEQRKIYESYLKQNTQIHDKEKIHELMMQNSFYVMEYVKQNINEIDNISFEGLVLNEEFKNEIAQTLIENGYVINQNTPMFLRKNQEFVYEYLLKNNLEFNGLEARDISPLLMLENISKHPEYIDLYKLLEDGKVHSDASIYIKAFGFDNAMAYYNEFENEIKLLDITKKYESLDDVKKDLKDKIMKLPNNIDKYMLCEKFKIEYILDDTMQGVEQYLKTNLDALHRYKGYNEKIIEYAIKNDFFANKTNEQLKEFFAHNPLQGKSAKLINYLVEQKGVEYFKYYRGDDENVYIKALEKGFSFEKDELIERINISSKLKESSELIGYLMKNESLEFFQLYDGYDKKIFEEAINLGFFDNKNQIEIEQSLIEKYNWSNSTEIMKIFIDKYNIQIFDYYNGLDAELIENALNKGYILSKEVFMKNGNFKKNIIMVNEAIKIDPYLFAHAQLNQHDTEKALLNSLKLIVGENKYNNLILDENIKEQLYDLYSIGGTIDEKTRILKIFTPKILETIGYKNDELEYGYDINTLIKYANSNPMLEEVIQIINNGNYNEFIEFYKHTKNLINDDSAIGINKFLYFSHLYSINPNLCVELLEKIKVGYELKDEEKSNLYNIIYKDTIENKEKLHFENLISLLDDENKKYKNNLEKDLGLNSIKNDMFQYLFGYSNSDIINFLNKNMNTLTLTTMINRAIEDNNNELRIVAEQANVIFEIIEQLNYYSGDERTLKEIAKKIYDASMEDIYKIRSVCGNLKELIRNIYEVEAQTELTDIGQILAAGEYTTVPSATDIKVIDLSNKKHTIYGHVLRTSIDTFFDTQKGKVTICLSAETDKHEAYYWNDSTKIKLGFTMFPEGNYIGSSTSNMGSNGSINNNDYRTDRVEMLYNQKSIRNLYEKGTLGMSHSEILAYRKGLIPTCIIMAGDVPTEFEISAARELKLKIKEVTGQDVEIPLVKTQHAHNRVLDYKNVEARVDLTSKEEMEKMQKEIENLRAGFLNIMPFNNELIRRDSSVGNYVIENGEAYAVNDVTEETIKKLNVIETQKRVQSIVHGEGNENCLETEKRVLNGKEVITTQIVDAEPVYSYSRGGQNLSKSSSCMLLKEFMVDHLMCCYSTDNSDILLDDSGKIYRKGGESSLENLYDFVNKKGDIYTNMSYLYFEGYSGNNIYRKVFENYIKNPDESQIFSQTDFDEFIESAKRVQEMDDDEYIRLFEQTIEKAKNPELMKQMIIKRKQTIVKESEEFVNRIQESRRIEQNPEKFENPNSIAIINDIHGNASALESILEECKRTGKKDVFILGDMIGFGPQSDECIELLRTKGDELNIRCILGNHELYSLMGNRSFRSGVDENTTRTRRSLSDENRRYIESLPMTRKIEVDGKMIELAHYLYKKDEKEDSNIYTGHNQRVDEIDGDSNIGYFVYGHEHGTESNIGDEVGKIRAYQIGNISCMNLPSSGCVHGKRTTYVTINNDNGLQFNVNAISYDKEKNDEAVRQNSPQKAHFFGVEI